jgi:PAS domain S-box-containing protein
MARRSTPLRPARPIPPPIPARGSALHPASPEHEGELHLRDFLKHADYLIQSTSMDGRVLFANEKWKRTLGYDERDLANGITVFDLLAPEAREVGEAAFRRMLDAEGSSREMELTVVAKDGRRVMLAGEAGCRIVDGAPVASRAIFRDVTAQRRAEAESRALELRYEGVVNVLGEGIAILSGDGIIEMVNPSAERILGLKASLVIGRHLLGWPWRILDEDGGEMPREAHPALVGLHTGREQTDAVIGVRHGSTGQMVWVAVNVRPLKRPGEKKAHAAVVSFRDVTAARAARTALRESEQRFRGILETVRSIALCLDTSGKVMFANDHFLKLTGWSREEVIGTDYFPRFVPTDHEVAEIFHARVAVGGFPTYYENEILTRDGASRTILWDTTPLRDDDGVIVGSASIGHDITERRRVERLKNELIATASHELRTPLTAIRGALEVVMSGGTPKDERDQRLLGMASRNAERLTRLVNDLLDVERIESGAEMMRAHVVRVTQLVGCAADLVRPVAEKHGTRVIVVPDDTAALADPDRIVQVLTNLLGNAIKFSEPGDVVTVSARAEGSEVCVQVRDQGRGIPAEKLVSVFEPFVQVHDSDARARGGAGLGLAISRAIVVQHGGRIWAESDGEGKGTTVSFTLPLAPVE